MHILLYNPYNELELDLDEIFMNRMLKSQSNFALIELYILIFRHFNYNQPCS